MCRLLLSHCKPIAKESLQQHIFTEKFNIELQHLQLTTTNQMTADRSMTIVAFKHP